MSQQEYQPTFGFAEKIDAEVANTVHSLESIVLNRFGDEIDFVELRYKGDVFTYQSNDEGWWINIKSFDAKGVCIEHSAGISVKSKKPYISTHHPYRHQIYGDEAITECYRALAKFGILSASNKSLNQELLSETVDKQFSFIEGVQGGIVFLGSGD